MLKHTRTFDNAAPFERVSTRLSTGVLFCEMGFQPNSTITHIRTRCVVCACAIDIGRSPADSHSSTGRTAKVNDLAWIFLPLQTGIFLVGSFLLHLSHHHLRSSSVTLCFAFLGTVHSCYRMFHLQFIDICSFFELRKIFLCFTAWHSTNDNHDPMSLVCKTFPVINGWMKQVLCG